MAIKELPLRLRTLSPVIITASHDSQVMTATQPIIPGNALRGVFASRYIRTHHLGRDAHKDQGFRRLFLGGLRFLAAQPERDGRRAFFLPLSLLKEKQKQGQPANLQDLFASEERLQGYKPFKGMAVQTGNRLAPVSTNTSIALHMTRADTKRRLRGSSQDGGIFNYEAIAAGQNFLGSIIGEEKDLDALCAGIGLRPDAHGFDCQIGRSHYTEYGHCRLELHPSAEPACLPEMSDVHDQAVLLRLDAPCLPLPSASACTLPNAKEALENLLQTYLGEGFSLGKFFSAADEAGGFVGIWCLQRPRVAGLAAGTAFELQKATPWTAEDLTRLRNIAAAGIGQRTEEGFGQLRVWRCADPKLASSTPAVQEKSPYVIPDTVKQQVKNILLRRIKEQLRIYAHDDAQGLRLPKDSQHAFSELSAMLYAAHMGNGSTREAMEHAIQSRKSHTDHYVRDKQEKANTPLQKKLADIHFPDGYSLDDCFTGGALPYERGHRSWAQDMDRRGHLQSLLQTMGWQEGDFPTDDGECYFEYWRWFFRFGRKKARLTGRNA